MSTPATRERILDHAEKLFAANGFAATSMRAITAAAEVNLAAVNYHFGSKEELLRAVLHRRIDPVNRARLARLSHAEAEAAPGVPTVEAIVRAFVEPTVEAFTGPDRRHVLALIRMVHLEDVIGRDFFVEEFGPVVERFRVLERALPHLDASEVALRFQFMVGALIHCVADDKKRHRHFLQADVGPDRMAEGLTAFLTAGFLAPASESAAPGEAKIPSGSRPHHQETRT